MGQGKIKGIKRRGVRLGGGGEGVYWQFQVRDTEECWMAIQSREGKKR